MIGVGHAQGQLLAQVRPSVTSAVQLLPSSTLRQEVTLIMMDNHGTGNVVIKIFHDDDGSTWTDNEGIIHRQIAQYEPPILFQAQHPGSGLFIAPGGTLGCSVSVINDVTFSVYGITETLAERIRGSQNA